MRSGEPGVLRVLPVVAATGVVWGLVVTGLLILWVESFANALGLEKRRVQR